MIITIKHKKQNAWDIRLEQQTKERESIYTIHNKNISYNKNGIINLFLADYSQERFRDKGPKLNTVRPIKQTILSRTTKGFFGVTTLMLK